ncbi:hypothetical protein [Pseudoxanthomonas sp.]|uniref:hypothetical protein n=1 Tax=Pseudoxanthomonas sp. TaxID=1871049 RepID=UPI002FE3AD42
MTTTKTSAFSTPLLDKVRNADFDSGGDKLGEVARIARSLNLDSFHGRSKLPILGPLIDKLRAAKDDRVQRCSSTNRSKSSARCATSPSRCGATRSPSSCRWPTSATRWNWPTPSTTPATS